MQNPPRPFIRGAGRGRGDTRLSPVQVISLDVGRDLGLPLVAVIEQLLLVVEQLLVRLRRELEVGTLPGCETFSQDSPDPPSPRAGGLAAPRGLSPRPDHLHDGVHRTSLLAEPAVDALGHVDVVAGGAAAAVGAGFGLDGDGLRGGDTAGDTSAPPAAAGGGGAGRKADLRGADGLAELAGDAPLLPGRVAAQRVLPAEPWAQRPLLKRVVDGGRFAEKVTQRHGQAWRKERGGDNMFCGAGTPQTGRGGQEGFVLHQSGSGTHRGRAQSTAGSAQRGR